MRDRYFLVVYIWTSSLQSNGTYKLNIQRNLFLPSALGTRWRPLYCFIGSTNTNDTSLFSVPYTFALKLHMPNHCCYSVRLKFTEFAISTSLYARSHHIANYVYRFDNVLN